MNKSKLISKTWELLKERGVRKRISSPKHVFHISDDEGNEKDFVVKGSDKDVYFNRKDVECILDACQSVIEDAIRHGEPVTIQGFGALGLKYRAARSTKQLGTDTPIEIAARYVPKFTFGSSLRMCAKFFEAQQQDQQSRADYIPEPIYDDVAYTPPDDLEPGDRTIWQ